MASRKSEDNEARQSLISDDKVTWNLHLPQRKHKSPSTARKVLPIVLGAIVSSALSVGLTILLLRHHWAVNSSSDSVALQTPPDKVNCGSNPTEARALGCVFQIWDYAWYAFSLTLSHSYPKLRAISSNISSRHRSPGISQMLIDCLGSLPHASTKDYMLNFAV